ncbi:MAG: glycosyltransferase family A protein [Pseudomonadota bacterium]
MNQTSTEAIPSISVVVPCYNAAATIEDCMRSVQAQTRNDWELIVVDDGSHDNSRTVVLDLAQRDPRIRLHAQANAGPAAARNCGVGLARGGIVAFLDSDDRWDPDHLALATAMLDADPALGVAFASCRILNDHGLPTGQRTRAWTNGVAIADILAGNPTATCSSLVVRKAVFETVGGMRDDMVHAEDQEWLFRVIRHGWRLRSHNRTTVGYRTSAGGLSANVERMFSGWRTFVQHARTLEPEIVARELPRARAAMHLYFARRMIRDGRFGMRPIEHVAQAVWAAPRVLLTSPTAVFTIACAAVTGTVAPTVTHSIIMSIGKMRHA